MPSEIIAALPLLYPATNLNAAIIRSAAIAAKIAFGFFPIRNAFLWRSFFAAPCLARLYSWLAAMFSQLDLFRGTFAPFFRASERPIAIACFLLFTRPPLPPFPDFRLPRLRLRIALFTDFPADLPYLGIACFSFQYFESSYSSGVRKLHFFPYAHN